MQYYTNLSFFLITGLIGGQYNPGFLTDLVREIRDAARIREEALYTRVRAMVLERTEVNTNIRCASLTAVCVDVLQFFFAFELNFTEKNVRRQPIQMYARLYVGR